MPNDFKNAISAYDKSNKGSLSDPREIEARALFKSADNLQNIKDNWPESQSLLDEALTKNRQLWTIFVASMEESTHIPIDLRSNIANLGIYTFKRTMEMLADPKPEKLDILISLNRNIATGLMESVQNSKTVTLPPEQRGESTASSAPISTSTVNTPPSQEEQPEKIDLDIDI